MARVAGGGWGMAALVGAAMVTDIGDGAGVQDSGVLVVGVEFMVSARQAVLFDVDSFTPEQYAKHCDEYGIMEIEIE